MSAPVLPKKLGEFSGRIVRWGAGGFGFIQCSELRKDMYFKESVVFGYDEPRVGDEVEFVAVEYPGDKIVAREVRVVGARQTRPSTPLAGHIRGLPSIAEAPPASRSQG